MHTRRHLDRFSRFRPTEKQTTLCCDVCSIACSAGDVGENWLKSYVPVLRRNGPVDISAIDTGLAAIDSGPRLDQIYL